MTHTAANVGIFQEPYVYNGVIPSVPTHSRTFLSKNQLAAIIYSGPLSPLLMKITEHTVSIRLDTSNCSIDIIAVYLPPSEDITSLLEELNSNLLTGASHCIIAGDFNATSQLWGADSENRRGIAVLEFLDSKHFIVINAQDSPPTFETSRARGWPDLTISTPNTTPYIQDWTVSDLPSLSDHKIITYRLDTPIDYIIKKRFKTAFGGHSVLREHIRAHVEKFIKDFNNCQDRNSLDNLYDLLVTKIVQAAHKAYRLKSVKAKHSISWWSPELNTERSRVRALRRKAQSTVDPYLRQLKMITYNKARALYKRKIKEAKLISWRTYCSNVTKAFGPTQKITCNKVFRPTTLSPMVNSTASSNIEVISEIINAVFPDDDEEDFLEEQEEARKTYSMKFRQVTRRDELPPTQMEVDNIIRTLAPKKAPGPDGIDNIIIREIHREFPKLFLAVISACWKHQYFPKNMKLAEVALFLKSGKTPAEPTSYRPVCLLPALGKVLERVILYRLDFFLQRNNALHPNQYGFRMGNSTEHAIKDLMATIKQNKDNNLHSLAIAIDIKGAFDSLWWPDVINLLHNMACPTAIITILRSYLQDRSVQVTSDSGIYVKNVFRGCPQGSCLGPTLWNIVANSAFRQFESVEYARIIAYADDFMLVVAGRSNLEMRSQYCLDLFSQWARAHKLQISAEKTKALLIGRSRQLRRNPSIKLHGIPVKCFPQLKYLGLLLDNRLSWMPHVRNLKTRISILSNNMRRMTSHKWGISSKLQKIWHRTITERVITYGAAIWGGELTSHMKRSLLSIQRQQLLQVCRAYRTTSTLALQQLAGIPPLDLIVEREAAIVRVTRLGQTSTLWGHSYHHSDYEEQNNCNNFHPAAFNLSDGISINDQPIQRYSNNLFTDGSKTENGTGSAFCRLENGVVTFEWKRKLGSNNSVYQAELLAISAAIRYANTCQQEKFSILSDSASSLAAIASQNSRSPLVYRIQKQLLTMPISQRPTLKWVPAHTGIQGNEAADLLAKQAANCTDILERPTKLPWSHIKRTTLTSLLQNWQSRWTEAEVGRRTFRLLPKVNMEIKTHCASLTQFLTGHGPFPVYLNRFRLRDTPFCECGEEGDTDHYYFHCVHTRTWHLKKPADCAWAMWTTNTLKNRIALDKIEKISGHCLSRNNRG